MRSLTFEHVRIDQAPGGRLVITPVRRGYCTTRCGGGITEPLEQYTVILDTAEVAKLKQLLEEK